MFPALLKHWRGVRGLSQLDLASAAEVSSRHVSFLETGRSKPSREMVLRLAATLDVPLREQNALLEAAGFAPQFEERPLVETEGPIKAALERMMAQQEPFPLVVLDRRFNVVMMNGGAQRAFPFWLAEPEAIGALNAYELIFDPRGIRPYVQGWPQLARALISRLQRESLHRPADDELGLLLSRLLAFPDVPASWREHDFSIPSEPTLSVRLKRDDLEIGFFTTVTAFQAPQNVALEETLIESYFPLDDATERWCRSLA